jgi:serine/threonine-protein kinase
MAGQTYSREFLELQGAVAGRYALERELGRGGMGIVFLDRDVALDRPVAVKLLPPYLAAQPSIRERFLQEARLVAGSPPQYRHRLRRRGAR